MFLFIDNTVFIIFMQMTIIQEKTEKKHGPPEGETRVRKCLILAAHEKTQHLRNAKIVKIF